MFFLGLSQKPAGWEFQVGSARLVLYIPRLPNTWWGGMTGPQKHTIRSHRSPQEVFAWKTRVYIIHSEIGWYNNTPSTPILEVKTKKATPSRESVVIKNWTSTMDYGMHWKYLSKDLLRDVVLIPPNLRKKNIESHLEKLDDPISWKKCLSPLSRTSSRKFWGAKTNTSTWRLSHGDPQSYPY